MKKPKTNFDMMRERLLAKKGLLHPVEKRFSSVEDLEKKYWPPSCDEFVRFMKNRLCMGGLRYADKTRQESKKTQGLFLKGCRQYMENYERTGNMEKLVDCANFILLEYKDGYHPNKHFEAEDDGEHYI